MLTIGLMSGTSMDAIDAALVRFEDPDLSVLAYEQYPIDDAVRRAVRALSADSDISEITRLDAVLGHGFAAASRRIIREAGLDRDDVQAIGSHGQTVLHLPDADYPRTLQIGDPNIIACETGITTVADFRRMDVAAGGQGAPLAPAFHNRYLRSREKDRVILNIGGIANITVLPRDENTPVLGFDTGPGNGLLDDWNQRHNGTPMDRDGAWAGGGKSDEELLGALLDDPYFGQPPPKSSGRDYFNLDWLERHLQAHGRSLSPQDVQASLLRLSARSIADALHRHAPATEELFVCGGGVHNPVLLRQLRQALPNVTVAPTGDLGVDPDTVEAITFAWLAKRRLEGKPGNLPSVTGAREAVLLGGIYQASHKQQATSYKALRRCLSL